jgi:type IV pilus assembly protein PilO
MPDLRNTRKKIKTGLIAMAVLDVVAIGLMVSPLIGSASSRREQLNQLWQELQTKTRQVEPLRGMDKKVALASKQIAAFYKDRLPGKESSISDQLTKIATENGVRIVQARFKADDAEPVGVAPVTIDADLSGDYVQIAKFVNALERDKMFFVVSGVTLGSEQSGPVKLQMRLETYLRTGD